MKILVINPGGSSTKIATFSTEKKPLIYTDKNRIKKRTKNINQCSSVALNKEFEETIRHPIKDLIRFKTIIDQLDYRKTLIVKAIGDMKFDAIVTRGGPLKPLKSGTYRITKKVVDDIKQGKIQSMHPSLLGPLIAYSLVQEYLKPITTEITENTEKKKVKINLNKLGEKRVCFSEFSVLSGKSIPAFFVDAESVDEFFPLARISGLPEIPRKSLSHFLNTNAVIRKAAKELGKRVNQCNFIVAHLGSGITIAANEKGKQIDANNANEDGPFSPQRTGSLPLQGVIDMCYSEKFTKKEMLDKIQRKGGLLAYLGTDDIPEIEKRIRNGDKYADLIYNAMIYQIAKEIGSMFVALKGKVTAIIITGGIAYQKNLVNKLKSWIRFVGKPILIFPGEEEMTALAEGAIRVLYKKEKLQKY